MRSNRTGIDESDIALFKSWVNSPIKFISDIWKLKPQPVIREFQDLVNDLVNQGQFNEIKAEYFEEWQKGQITWQQWLILLAVERGLKGLSSKRISVRSGHGIGKTACLSWLIIWYLMCHKGAQVPCTAPTGEQIHDILWKEIKIWIDRMPEQIMGLFEWQNGYVRVKDSPETWFARARTARKEAPEALAGVHGKYVFLVADEASAIPEEIFNTAEGSLTGENTLVALISNPTRLVGYFYDTHNSDKNNWQCLHFSSEDSPIVEENYINRIIEKHGKDSDEYAIRVKGEFPDAEAIDDKGFVPLIPADKIILNESDMPFSKGVKLGVDPAGEGDNKTAWVVRDRFQADAVATEAISSEKTIAQKTLTLKDHFNIENDEDIIVDNFGAGANVATELACAGCHPQAVNWGGKPDDEDEGIDAIYLNKRAECYFRLREWVLRGGVIKDKELAEELKQIKFKRNLAGKKQIMSKLEMRKEGIKSPDKCLIAGTKIKTISGDKNIEDIKVGNLVITPFGFRKVLKSELTYKNIEVYTVYFSNNSYLTGTKEHKIFTNRGILTIGALRRNDIIYPYRLFNLIVWKLQKIKNAFNTRGKIIGFREMVNILWGISTMEQEGSVEKRNYFIGLFGKITSARSLIILLSTILMEIPLTIILKIWHWLKNQSIFQNITIFGQMKNIEKSRLPILIRQEKKQISGTEQQMDLNYTKDLEGRRGKIENGKPQNVLTAEKSIKPLFQQEQNFVQGNVLLNGNIKISNIRQKRGFVRYVIKSFLRYIQEKMNVVVENVEVNCGGADVYNLTVEKDNCYFANDILVSNSDALALTFYDEDDIPSFVESIVHHTKENIYSGV